MIDRLADHLANERTHLAWVRTGLAFITFGLAMNAYGRSRNSFEHLEFIGLGTIALGLAALVYAAIRVLRVSRDIDRDDYRPNPRFLASFAFITALAGAIGAAWLILS